MTNYYPNQQYNNYGYAAPRPQARNTQPLTPEQIAKLRQDNKAFDMKVDQEDLWRAACTHKEKNGHTTLIQNPDGSYTCTICHKTFRMCEDNEEQIAECTRKIIDVLQTIKTLYLDAPEKLIEGYMQQIPLLEKLPSLWKRSISNFSQYEGTINGSVNPMAPGYSGFNAIQSLLTNPYAGFNGMAPQYPGYQQPAYSQPYNGYAPAQPMTAPMVDPNYNPMAYGVPTAPVAPMAPVAPAPGVMPGTVQPAPAPAAPVAPAPTAAPVETKQGEVQQQAVFNV